MDGQTVHRLNAYDPAKWSWFISLQFHVHCRDSELYDVCRINWLITLTLATLDRHKMCVGDMMMFH
jgi:hypothetical protein